MRKNLRKLKRLGLGVISGMFALNSLQAQSQEDSTEFSKKTIELSNVVVTGTKYEVPIERSGRSIYKITAKEIQDKQGKSIASILNEVPGIQIDGNFGPLGTNISYFVRGARNRHTLVLIDGVPINDPSQIEASFDLNYLPLNQIEEIEVLKGGLSTLYGTNAAAGVINIKLKESSEELIEGSLNLSGGSFNTFEQGLNLRGRSNKFSYIVSGANITSDGFSAALQTDPSQDFDDDGFDRQNFLTKLSYDLQDSWKIGITAAYDNFDTDFDGGALFDAFNTIANQQWRVGLNSQRTTEKGVTSLSATINDNERAFDFDGFGTQSDGTNIQIDLNHKENITENVTLLTGFNYQNLRFEGTSGDFVTNADDTTQFNIYDPYASLEINTPFNFNLQGGIRVNIHSEYETNVVWNVTPSYLIELDNEYSLKVFGSISTSFISPSLFQLFSSFGNPELVPEETLNYEGGFSLYGPRSFSFNASYFKRDEEDAIFFISFFDEEGNFTGGTYLNSDVTRTVEGLEFDASINLTDNFSVSGNYSVFFDLENVISNNRIPNSKLGFKLDYEPIEKGTISLQYNRTGDRMDFLATEGGNFGTLSDFQLVDVHLSYGNLLNQKLRTYVSLNNIFDEDFIAISGFTTVGFNYRVGLEYKF